MARIEFNQDPDKGFTPVPAGTYQLQVTKAEFKTNKKGNPTMQLGAEIAEGDKAGKKVTIFFPMLEQSGWRLKSLIEACDIDFEESEDKKNLAFDDEELIGTYFEATCSVGEWEGKPKNDWEKFAQSKLSAKVDTTPAAGVADAAAASTASAAGAAAAGGAVMQRRSRRTA